MTTGVAVALAGLLAFVVGAGLGAAALFGALGVAGVLVVFGVALTAVGLLVDFERGRS